METIHYEQLKIRIKSEFQSEYYSIEKSLKNPCKTSQRFAKEYIWVVINSGMKYQIALKIYNSIIKGLENEIPARYIFNHENKAEAIQYGYRERKKIFSEYKKAEDKIDYLKSLPWIGDVTKFHLARNLGINVCKPDRHLVRISKRFNTDPSKLCKDLSAETGDLVGMVDFVLWGSGNLGLI